MTNNIKILSATSEQLNIEGDNITICFATEKNKEVEKQVYKLLAESIISKLRM